MRASILVLASVLTWLAAGPGAAQTQQDVDACNGAPPQYSPGQTIGGCTSIIAAGGADAANMSIFYMNRGVALDRSGSHTSALNDYNEAIRLNPRNDMAFSNRGSSYLGQESYGLAMADLDQAIRLNPRNSAAFYNRGLVFKAQSSPARAIADFDQAIRLEPTYAGAYVARGEARVSLGDLTGALADANQAIALDAQYARGYFIRAALKAGAGAFDQALADIDRFIQLDPQEPLGPQLRATILEEKARAGGAAVAGPGPGVPRWGMSAPAVASMYPGGKSFDAYGFYVPKPGEFRGITYRTISFSFVRTGEGLERISLETTEPAATLRRKLTALYGAPATERDPHGHADRFVDRASGDRIVVVVDTRNDWSSVTWFAGQSPRVAQVLAAGQAPQWYSPLSEFQTNFPAARQLMEGSIFWGLDAPRLHGRNWKRGHFSFSGDKLNAYTLFSADSYDAIIGDFATRYAPAEAFPPERGFRDPTARSTLSVRRNGDGTAIVTVRPAS